MSHEIEALQRERTNLIIEHLSTLRAMQEMVAEAKAEERTLTDTDHVAIQRMLADLNARAMLLIQKGDALAAKRIRA